MTTLEVLLERRKDLFADSLLEGHQEQEREGEQRQHGDGPSAPLKKIFYELSNASTLLAAAQEGPVYHDDNPIWHHTLPLDNRRARRDLVCANKFESMVWKQGIEDSERKKKLCAAVLDKHVHEMGDRDTSFVIKEIVRLARVTRQRQKWHIVKLVRSCEHNEEGRVFCFLLAHVECKVGIVFPPPPDFTEADIGEWIKNEERGWKLMEWVVSMAAFCETRVWMRHDVICKPDRIEQVVRPKNHVGNNLHPSFGIGAEDLIAIIAKKYIHIFLAEWFNIKFLSEHDEPAKDLDMENQKRRISSDRNNGKYIQYLERFHMFLENYTGGDTEGDIASLYRSVVGLNPLCETAMWGVTCHLLRTFDVRMNIQPTFLPTSERLPSPAWRHIQRAVINSLCSGLIILLPEPENEDQYKYLVGKVIIGLRLPWIHGGFVHLVSKGEAWWSNARLKPLHLLGFDEVSWPLRTDRAPYLYVGRTGPDEGIRPYEDTFESFRKRKFFPDSSEDLDFLSADAIRGEYTYSQELDVDLLNRLCRRNLHEQYVLTLRQSFDRDKFRIDGEEIFGVRRFARQHIRASVRTCLDAIERLPGPILYWHEEEEPKKENSCWKNILLKREAQAVCLHRKWLESFSSWGALITCAIAATVIAVDKIPVQNDLIYNIFGVILAGSMMQIQLPFAGVCLGVYVGIVRDWRVFHWPLWLQEDRSSHFILSAVFLFSGLMYQYASGNKSRLEQCGLQKTTADDICKRTRERIENHIGTLDHLITAIQWVAWIFAGLILLVSVRCLVFSVWHHVWRRERSFIQDDIGKELENPKLGNVTFSNIARKDGTVFGVLSGSKSFGFRCGDVTSIGMSWVRIQEQELAQEVEDLPWCQTNKDASVGGNDRWSKKEKSWRVCG